MRVFVSPSKTQDPGTQRLEVSLVGGHSRIDCWKLKSCLIMHPETYEAANPSEGKMAAPDNSVLAKYEQMMRLMEVFLHLLSSQIRF